MQKFNKLSRAEMKNVMGGLVDKKRYKCCDSEGACSACYGYDVTPHCPRKGDTLTECSDW
jgi:hypothetical protein